MPVIVASTHQASRVEKARVTGDLELRIDEETASRYDAFRFGQSAKDRKKFTSSRAKYHFPQFEQPAGTLYVQDATRSTIEYRGYGHGQQSAIVRRRGWAYRFQFHPTD